MIPPSPRQTLYLQDAGKIGKLIRSGTLRPGERVPSVRRACEGSVVAALTTAGYAGMLMGPAVIGFLSREIGLHSAFWFLAALLACVPIFGKFLTVENPD
jgi:MFS family permease